MASVRFRADFQIFMAFIWSTVEEIWHYVFTNFSYIVSASCFGLGVFLFQDTKDSFSCSDFF